MTAPAAVQFYDVVVFFHVLAMVLAFGPGFAYGLFFANAAKHSPAALPSIASTVLIWSRTVTLIGALVVLASGLYLVEDRWEHSDFFVAWGELAILILLALNLFFFIPTTRKFIAAAEAGRGEEAQAIAVKQRVVGPITGIIVILTVYVMTAKPFL
ncbi:MAG: DUF2269 family protein [Actinomycetota bacterium]|nr:DUF2269 family protein [Actinomycetota bacterium]